MDRIPEPELMDEAAQALAYASADFSEPHDAFVARFRRCFPDFIGGSVLDLGCGPADVTMRFARAYPAAQILGVDGASAMLTLGCDAVAATDLEGRVRLLQVRLPAESFPGSPYAGVISNSLLHHLADPRVLWEAIVSAAAPGACVFVMDLMRPPSREAASQLLALHAADAPEVLRRDFFNSLLAAFRPDEVRQQLADSGLPYLRVEVASDRHLIAYGRMSR
ncbi:MAG: class I SAM-dependent methyltransferase [Burkholderiales bacterium]